MIEKLPTYLLHRTIHKCTRTYNRIYKKKFRGNMSIHLRIYILENWILNFLILLYISVSATASVPVAVPVTGDYIVLFSAVSECATSHLYSEDLWRKWLSEFVCGCITIHSWRLFLCSFLLITFTSLQYINERIGIVYILLDIRWEESTWKGIHSWMYLYAHFEHTYMIW